MAEQQSWVAPLEQAASHRFSGWFVGASRTFLLPVPLPDARPLLELPCQLLIGRERPVHGIDETPDLLGERNLPCSQEGISRGDPTRDHLGGTSRGTGDLLDLGL